jgi:hypothetical protein
LLWQRWKVFHRFGYWSDNDPVSIGRYYIPNEGVREQMGTSMDVSKTVPFCGKCMRVVEDNMRATVMYLQAENGTLVIKATAPL